MQYVLGRRAALLQGMFAVREDFRLDDGNQPGFLAQRGVAGRSLRVDLDAPSAGNATADNNHRAPFGEAGSHLNASFRRLRNPSRPAFSDLFSRMSGEVLGANVALDAGK